MTKKSRNIIIGVIAAIVIVAIAWFSFGKKGGSNQKDLLLQWVL